MKVEIEEFHAKKENRVGESVAVFPDQFTVFLCNDEGKNRQQVGYCWKSTGNFAPIEGLEDEEMKLCREAVEAHTGKEGKFGAFNPIESKEVNVDEADK